MFPNLIIPGAQKCGTTSVYQYLAGHPDCYMSTKKETNFFSRRDNLKQIDKYEQHFPIPTDKFKVVGECSPSYMMDKLAPERIAHLLGNDVRFIFVLRNPAKRTISAYWHCAKTRRDLRRIGDALQFNSKSIDSVLREESQRLEEGLARGGIRPHSLDEFEDKKMIFRYVENSLYSRQTDRFLQFFKRDSIHFIVLEKLTKDPDNVLRAVSSFLQIPDQFNRKSIQSRHNKTVIERHGVSLSVLKKCVACLPKQFKTSFQELRNHYRKLLYSPTPKTPRDLLKNLNELFQPEIRHMSKLLGDDLDDVWGSE